MADNELVTVDKKNAMVFFTTDKGLDPLLAKVRAEIDGFIPDVSTKRGRDQIASIAYRVAKSKTYLDGVGKDLVAEQKKIPNKIDAERKRMRDTLDQWRDEVRAPLNEWEAAEEARVDGHRRAIQAIIDIGRFTIGGELQPFEVLFAELEMIKVDASFEEFEVEAYREKEVAKRRLDAALEQYRKQEAERLELERLRAEAVAREQQDREERIAREAADNARAESAHRETQLRLDAERAEREKLEAIHRAERIEREQQEKVAAQKAEADRREADRLHVTTVHSEVVADMVAAGMERYDAEVAVRAIVSKSIRHITISY